MKNYVSFETSKLLKEKGFDEPTNCFYFINGTFSNNNFYTKNSYTRHYAAPTLQITMEWLRKTHFLFIDINPLTGYKWSWSIWLMNDPNQKVGESVEVFSTDKEAIEAAIKYGLENLI